MMPSPAHLAHPHTPYLVTGPAGLWMSVSAPTRGKVKTLEAVTTTTTTTTFSKSACVCFNAASRNNWDSPGRPGSPGPGNLASAGCGPASSRGHTHDADESQRSRWGVAHPRRGASASDSRPIHDRLRLSKTASPARVNPIPSQSTIHHPNPT